MKKFKYIGTLVLLLAMATSYGQDNQVLPRLTAEEQQQLENSIPVNPARIQVSDQVDPRMTPAETASGETNWKPAEVPADDRPVPEPSKKIVQDETGDQSSAQNGSQPEGLKSPNGVRNLREIQGNPTQPDAPKAENVTNYRELKGTSDTQPEGEKPKR
jgi:hypothetical protein